MLAADVTLFPRSRAEFERLRQFNAEAANGCLDGTGPLVGHVDTVSAARDHEALRLAMGERQITWFGISYGTQLAINYAALYPKATRAMVLDSALEHSGSETAMLAEEIRTVEDSFNRFAAWCATDETCALKGQDVAHVYDDLVARADRNPIPVPGALRPVTGEDIRMGTPALLTFKEPTIFGPGKSWAALSRAIKASVEGDASAFMQPPAEEAGGIGQLLSIGCGDYVSEIKTWDDMRQRIQLGRQLAPHLQGATEQWQVLRCIDWPLPAANPLRRLDVRGVPALVVNATHDPSTSYAWAHGLLGQIEGSALLTRIGDGHTSYYTSACAKAAMDAYMVRPEAPADRTCT
jgi:pimeloyl-ACP methyl ester carboxylesterase